MCSSCRFYVAIVLSLRTLPVVCDKCLVPIVNSSAKIRKRGGEVIAVQSRVSLDNLSGKLKLERKPQWHDVSLRGLRKPPATQSWVGRCPTHRCRDKFVIRHNMTCVEMVPIMKEIYLS
jgi:hypothetical protein